MTKPDEPSLARRAPEPEVQTRRPALGNRLLWWAMTMLAMGLVSGAGGWIGAVNGHGERIKATEVRADALEKKYIEFKESVDKRFDKVDARFDKVDARQDRLEAKIDEVLRRMPK